MSVLLAVSAFLPFIGSNLGFHFVALHWSASTTTCRPGIFVINIEFHIFTLLFSALKKQLSLISDNLVRNEPKKNKRASGKLKKHAKEVEKYTPGNGSMKRKLAGGHSSR